MLQYFCIRFLLIDSAHTSLMHQSSLVLLVKSILLLSIVASIEV